MRSRRHLYRRSRHCHTNPGFYPVLIANWSSPPPRRSQESSRSFFALRMKTVPCKKTHLPKPAPCKDLIRCSQTYSGPGETRARFLLGQLLAPRRERFCWMQPRKNEAGTDLRLCGCWSRNGSVNTPEQSSPARHQSNPVATATTSNPCTD